MVVESGILAFVPELGAVDGAVAEFFFDAEELVVFGDAVAAGGGAGFDLAAVGGDGDVGDGGVFGFAGAVGEDRGVAVAHGELDGFEGFGEGADLVDLHEDGVGGFGFDAFLEELGVGDEEVIADELDFVAELVGEFFPAVPVVFGHAVFDGADGVFGGPIGPDGGELIGGDDFL